MLRGMLPQWVQRTIDTCLIVLNHIFKVNKPLSKEELVARLKVIASDDTPRIRNFGAMCYVRGSAPEKHVNCDVCNNDTEYSDFNTHDTILEMVRKMRILGYDVKVQTVCENCAETLYKEANSDSKVKLDDDFVFSKDIYFDEINHIFYFRASGDTDYHRVVTNNAYKYQSLLTLLQNKAKYDDDYDYSHYIAEEKEILELMTGIKFDI